MYKKHMRDWSAYASDIEEIVKKKVARLKDLDYKKLIAKSAKAHNRFQKGFVRPGGLKKLGRPFSGKAPNESDLYHLYAVKRLSIRKIAAVSNCSKDIIYRALYRYYIKTRPNIKSYKLKSVSASQIEQRIKLRGLRGAAIYFGVHHSTLARYLKKINEQRMASGDHNKKTSS
jgi:hypothetical protein